MCINILKNDTDKIRKEAELDNLKSRGFLIHLNNNLFKILQVLKTYFSKHTSSNNVFENITNFSYTLHV